MFARAWLLLAIVPVLLAAGTTPFRTLQPGVEYGTFVLTNAPTHGDGLLHVVRVDPARAPPVLRLAPKLAKSRAAAAWSRDEGLSIVINAGMFQDDLVTHAGLLRDGTNLQSPKWVASYRSLFVLDPVQAGLPFATLLDSTDRKQADPRLASYRSVVQNLRLVGGPGENHWPQQSKRWSEAALGLDRSGRLLFLFTRTPLSMHDFNARLLALPLGLVRAQHLEGGPEASLSIHAGGVDLDLCGSYETGFHEDDSNQHQWSIPNVIGIRAVSRP